MGCRRKVLMSTNQLDSMIAKAEGKKSQVSMGNVREVRAIIDRLIRDNKKVRARFAAMFKVS